MSRPRTPTIKVYHYAQLSDWTPIATGDEEVEPTGLVPQRNIGAADRDAWKTPAIFGFVNPTPTEWVKNPHFNDIWKRQHRELGILLLEINVNPYTDTALVADRGYIEGYLYKDKTGIPTQYVEEHREPAERKYMASRVPLLDYTTNPEKFQFSLPEVLIPQHVPLEKISVSRIQPRLEGILQLYPEGGRLHQQVLGFAQSIPGLKPWYEGHQLQQAEGYSRGKERG